MTQPMIEGPFGLPMTDSQAQAVEAIRKDLPRGPDYEPMRILEKGSALEGVQPGERSDVSWITSEGPDHQHDVVLSSGMNDQAFALNPIVTLNHSYWTAPIGRSVWRKRARDDQKRGIKARTHYPPRPDSLPERDDWAPDTAFALVQAGLLNGKSVGILPTKVRQPTDSERKRAGWEKVERIIEEWALLEYAACWIPVQPQAVVEAVSKGLVTPAQLAEAGIQAQPDIIIPFMTLKEYAARFVHALSHIPHTATDDKVKAALNRMAGRV